MAAARSWRPGRPPSLVDRARQVVVADQVVPLVGLLVLPVAEAVPQLDRAAVAAAVTVVHVQAPAAPVVDQPGMAGPVAGQPPQLVGLEAAEALPGLDDGTVAAALTVVGVQA